MRSLGALGLALALTAIGVGCAGPTTAETSPGAQASGRDQRPADAPPPTAPSPTAESSKPLLDERAREEAPVDAPFKQYRSVCDADGVGQSFDALFTLGERCAQYAPLAGALKMAERVPGPRRWIVYDGIAHGLGPVPEDPSSFVTVINALASPEARLLLHDGVIRAWTEAARGEPELVLPWVSRYVADNGLKDGYNGVRVGLQRSRAEDIRDAVDLALHYPLDWHVALMEELGWRAGNDVRLADVTLDPLLRRIPAESRCAFVQGAARGWTLKRPWDLPTAWPTTWAFLSELPVTCHAEMITGVAWGLNLLGESPDASGELLQVVADPELRAELEDRLRRIQSEREANIWAP